jgi:hypothetical protein
MLKGKALEHIHDSDRAEFLSLFRQNGSSWPQILNSEHVTRLILLQKLNRLGLVGYSPLDDPEFVAAAGGEGVEGAGCHEGPTGQSPQKNFSAEKGLNLKKAPENSGFGRAGTEGLLELLKSLEIYVIELKPLDRFERAVLSKARLLLEAELDHRRKTKNRWQVGTNRARARWRRRYRKRREKRLMAKQKEKEPNESAIERSQELIRKVLDEEPEGFGSPSGPGPESRPDAADYADGLEATRSEAEAGLERIVGSRDSVSEIEEDFLPAKRPEVELEIVRVGPNPRILQCKYKVLAEERKVYLWVKTNRNFVRGMKLKVAEQDGVDWKWEGALPRFRGRW